MQTRSPLPTMLLMPAIENRSTNRVIYLTMVFIFLLMEWGSSLAQGLAPSLGADSAPVLGGTGGVRPSTQFPLISGTQNAKVKIHLGPLGKPCLTVSGHVQPQIMNPDIFDHMISASNNCGQPIKMQVCYYQTQTCILVNTPAYGRKEVVLGIMPAMKQFQFEYREQFDQNTGGLGIGLN
jgi:hypothetical protein